MICTQNLFASNGADLWSPAAPSPFLSAAIARYGKRGSPAGSHRGRMVGGGANAWHVARSHLAKFALTARIYETRRRWRIRSRTRGMRTYDPIVQRQRRPLAVGNTALPYWRTSRCGFHPGFNGKRRSTARHGAGRQCADRAGEGARRSRVARLAVAAQFEFGILRARANVCETKQHIVLDVFVDAIYSGFGRLM